MVIEWENIYLIGGDWNHGIWIDFPETVENFIIPTDELHHFSEGVGSTTNQSSFIIYWITIIMIIINHY